MDLFVRLNGEGQTIVMVTHNPVVAGLAGRTVRMRDGRIEDGSLDQAASAAAARPARS
jgi:ABC-type lipoprotein export system ATPase subunit